ncbi:hypothetical protein CDCA_CDCA05G1622 [Cyanidium caldarium]|uniref:GPI inositol-deacylase n=1 Tax=Cyanidium caldarium TaxID=2771 RepID=A0AAV9ITL3_CYACA|nr:hypothetical protein CDCA_CDCA05G1622 [Cyanidium caldarium]
MAGAVLSTGESGCGRRRQVLRWLVAAQVGQAGERLRVVRELEAALAGVREEVLRQGGGSVLERLARAWRVEVEAAGWWALARSRYWGGRVGSLAVLSRECRAASVCAGRLLLEVAPQQLEESTPLQLEMARNAQLAPLLWQRWLRRRPSSVLPVHGGRVRGVTVLEALRVALEKVLDTGGGSEWTQWMPMYSMDEDGLLAMPYERPEREQASALAVAAVRRGDPRAVSILLRHCDAPCSEEVMRALLAVALWRFEEQDVGDRGNIYDDAEDDDGQSSAAADRAPHASDALRHALARGLPSVFSQRLAAAYPEWIRVLTQWRLRDDHSLLRACAISALENACNEADGKRCAVRYDDDVYVLAPDEALSTSFAPGLDIVLVHGIRGDPLLTWRCGAMQSAAEEAAAAEAPVRTSKRTVGVWRERLWPREWLARDLGDDRVRILTVGYASALTAWGSSARTPAPPPLREQALTLRHKLVQAGVGQRALLLVAHSYGGLIAKQLAVSEAVSDPPGALLEALRGVVFYSTPHHGSSFAGKILGGVLDKAMRPAVPLTEMLPYNDTLETLHACFLAVLRDPERRLHGSERLHHRMGQWWESWLRATHEHRQRRQREWEMGATEAGMYDTAVSRARTLAERGDQIMDVLGPVAVGLDYVQGLLREQDPNGSVEDHRRPPMLPRTPALPSAVRVLSFAEGRPTQTWGGGRFRMVTPASADPGIGTVVRVAHADHLQVCKPPSRDDIRYRGVLEVACDILHSVEVGGERV